MLKLFMYSKLLFHSIGIYLPPEVYESEFSYSTFSLTIGIFTSFLKETLEVFKSILLVIFICFALVTNKFEHIFMFLAMWIFYFEILVQVIFGLAFSYYFIEDIDILIGY